MALRSCEMSGAAEATAGGGKARPFDVLHISFDRCVGCMKEKYVIKPGICHFTSAHSHVHDKQEGLSYLSL